jgi:hypothetical protein
MVMTLDTMLEVAIVSSGWDVDNTGCSDSTARSMTSTGSNGLMVTFPGWESKKLNCSDL